MKFSEFLKSACVHQKIIFSDRSFPELFWYISKNKSEFKISIMGRLKPFQRLLLYLNWSCSWKNIRHSMCEHHMRASILKLARRKIQRGKLILWNCTYILDYKNSVKLVSIIILPLRKGKNGFHCEILQGINYKKSKFSHWNSNFFIFIFFQHETTVRRSTAIKPLGSLRPVDSEAVIGAAAVG